MTRLLLAAPLLALSVSCTKEDPGEKPRLAGNEAYKKGDYARAAESLEASVKANPKQDAAVYEKAAFSYMKTGNFDKMAELLLATVPLKTKEEDKLAVFRNVAAMYMQQAGDSEKAEATFKKALELNPKDEQTISWLGELASQRGGARSNDAPADIKHLEEALNYYQQLIGLYPENPAHYTNKRIVLTKTIGYYQQQKAAAETDAVENKADKDTAGDFLAQAKKYEEKIAELKGTIDETSKKLGELLKAKKK